MVVVVVAIVVIVIVSFLEQSARLSSEPRPLSSPVRGGEGLGFRV